MTDTKPGWKTSEFWLAVVAMLASALLGSGLLVPTSTLAKVVGLIAGVLAALGYTASRTAVKTATLKADAPKSPLAPQVQNTVVNETLPAIGGDPPGYSDGGGA